MSPVVPGLSLVHLGRQALGALAVSMGSLLWGCSIGDHLSDLSDLSDLTLLS